MAFHIKAAVHHGHHHFAAQVLVVVHRRDGEISFFVARTIAQIVVFPARIPASFFRVNEIEPVLLALVEANVIEDEELGFGAEVGGIGEARGSQIKLGFLCDVARIAVVALFGDGIDYVADHDQGGHFGESVEHVGRRVRDQEHVAFIDRRPTADGRAVHAETFFERIFG